MEKKAIKLFGKTIERYAFFRIILFGIGLVTLLISLIVTPQIETLDFDSLTDADLFEGSIFFWSIVLLLLIFAFTIIGFIVIGMFGKYLVQLIKVSKTTSSLFLRNILICELFRVIILIIQLFFLGSASQIPIYALNCSSLGISVYEITQFKKWVGFLGDYKLNPEEIISLQTYLKIWNICIISFIGLSFIQFFYDEFFLIILECVLIIVISVVLWLFGKKIIWFFS